MYLPGEAPEAGSLLRNPALAATLRAIANGGSRAFYEGTVAARLASFIDSLGGHLTADDFRAHSSTWVDPLSADYLGAQLHVLPPNTQGIAQLALAEMASHQPLAELGHNSPSYIHTLVELKKLAFADRNQWVADPDFADIPVARLLNPAYLAARARAFDPELAAAHVPPGVTGESAQRRRERNPTTPAIPSTSRSWTSGETRSLGFRASFTALAPAC